MKNHLCKHYKWKERRKERRERKNYYTHRQHIVHTNMYIHDCTHFRRKGGGGGRECGREGGGRGCERKGCRVGEKLRE